MKVVTEESPSAARASRRSAISTSTAVSRQNTPVQIGRGIPAGHPYHHHSPFLYCPPQQPIIRSGSRVTESPCAQSYNFELRTNPKSLKNRLSRVLVTIRLKMLCLVRPPVWLGNLPTSSIPTCRSPLQITPAPTVMQQGPILRSISPTLIQTRVSNHCHVTVPS